MEVAAVLDLVRDEKAAVGAAVLRDAAGEPIETVLCEYLDVVRLRIALAHRRMRADCEAQVAEALREHRAAAHAAHAAHGDGRVARGAAPAPPAAAPVPAQRASAFSQANPMSAPAAAPLAPVAAPPAPAPMVVVTVDLDAAVSDAEAQQIAPPPPGRARDDDAGGAHHHHEGRPGPELHPHHARRASIQRAAETAAETVQTEAERARAALLRARAQHNLERHCRHAEFVARLSALPPEQRDIGHALHRTLDHLKHCLLYTSPSPRD